MHKTPLHHGSLKRLLEHLFVRQVHCCYLLSIGRARCV